MKKLQVIAYVTILTALSICSCSTLPQKDAIEQSLTPARHEDTKLARIFPARAGADSNDSGFLLLRDGRRAFTERLHLADMAERTIDAQYYIWNSDKTGKLLMQKLTQAAERGVSVRLLLDDFSIGDRNDQLLTINSHPNIQVRIYNPFMVRSGFGKWLNFAFDFDRLNRRSHNKTYTVDQTVAITGGRNIGDEYFNHNEHLNFSDADLLSIGPVVQQVSKSFLHYWNSPWAVPVDKLIERRSNDPVDELIHAFLMQDFTTPLQIAIPANLSVLENHFHQVAMELVKAEGSFIADTPGGETDAYSDEPKNVAKHLVELAANSSDEILIESAYFVLNDEALKVASEVREKGVRIRALTNSMASNDVLPNHASYAMVRGDMLTHGIELHELRPDAESCLELIGRIEYCDEDSHLGLHAKTAVFDREIVYVGSMNLNLRSAYLNTEAAMIINSTILAEQLAGQIERNMEQQNSWQVIRTQEDITWVTETAGREEVSTHEPLTSWLERVKAGLLKLMPGALYY